LIRRGYFHNRIGEVSLSFDEDELAIMLGLVIKGAKPQPALSRSVTLGG
jgi:hypothetical protein